MARVHNYCMTFIGATAKLRGRDSVTLPGSATRLERLSDGTIGVRYHATIIVQIHPDDTYTLRSGGYHTVTTKRKIGEYSPAMLYQHDFGWFVKGGYSWDDRKWHSEFREGMRVDSSGNVKGADIDPMSGRVNYCATRGA